MDGFLGVNVDEGKGGPVRTRMWGGLIEGLCCFDLGGWMGAFDVALVL